ncbi:MAG: sulfatase-like hydrolase/transferase, partial [Oscillospiraceae bacterium]|nr:sulfatase-like hydrolase/transferase [Oscillospiraceae bacterium]
HRYEGFRETVESYRSYPLPEDLTFLKGDYQEMYPDYLSAINRLDYNVGRLREKLRQLGIEKDTVILYTSDHGSHFKTRNAEYKRSCHESSVHTPLIIKGAGFTGGKREKRLTSLIDLPPTLLSLAGIPVPEHYQGIDLTGLTEEPENRRDCVFIQISESQCGRAIRTEKYKYSVMSPGFPLFGDRSSKVYCEAYLYDLEKDPLEKHNLIKDPEYKAARDMLKKILTDQMKNAHEKVPVILPALNSREK